MDNCIITHHDIFKLFRGLKNDLKNKKVFTHVETLAKKNVEHIFAGGHHSWALLNYSYPIIDDYEPPSPLRTPMVTPNVEKSGYS